MNSFQPHRIQETRGIADDQSTVKVILSPRPTTAFGNRLGAVGVELAPVQDALDIGMSVELLKSLMRIQARIQVIEADDEPNGDAAVRHVVNESTAELFIAKRPSHRVDHAPAGVRFLRHIPDFLHSGGIDLRISAFVEPELLDELFGQRASRALGKNSDLGSNVDSRFEITLFAATSVDAFVAGPNAREPIILDYQIRAGESWKNVNAAFFDLFAEPAREFVERDDVISMILERWRNDR